MPPTLRKLFFLTIAGLLGLAAPLRADLAAGPPTAKKILVITGTDAMTDFVTFINQSTAWWSCPADVNGSGFLAEVQIHNQTVQTTVPALATLQTYDEVWDMRFSAANCQGTVAACGTNGITPAQQADYLSYIAGGGSLFLMGDNGGYPGRNDPIMAIANAVDSAGTFSTSGMTTNNDTVQGAYINIAAATAAENFQSDYRDLTGSFRFIATQYNGLVPNYGAGYPVLKDNLTGQATAIAFDCGNMKPAYKAGKLMVAFDWQMMGGGGQVGYCGPPSTTGTTIGYNERFWENSIDFLVPGNVCTTPTPTATYSSTPTATPTRTATPSATPSSTPTATPTTSPTRTATPSPTPSATPSATRTESPTLTTTPTATPTATQSVTRSATPTSTPTPTQTLTATPSNTASPLASATNTPSITGTYTATSSSTATPTCTPSRTPTPTYTDTPTSSPTLSPTDTPSITLTATPSVTLTETPSITPTSSDTPIYSATSTPTFTATPSATPSFTETDTRTVTPTASPTVTPSATRTETSTYTVSPTITPTPIPMPFHITARVYNSAGELVRQIYDGGINQLPTELTLDRGAFVGGFDMVTAGLPGVLSNGGPITWNGSTATGALVSAGTYYIKLEAVDPFGQTTSMISPVMVLPGPTEASLTLSNDAGEIVWSVPLPSSAVGFTLDSTVAVMAGEGQAGSGNTALRVWVKNAAGVAIPIDWDGRNPQGRQVEPGTYTLSLSSTQAGGSTQVQSAKIAVLRGPDAVLLADALLVPNPAVNAASAQLRYTVVPGLDAYADLFSLDGERVVSSTDPAFTGKLVFDLSHLAGGIYLCVAHQGPQHRLLKLAVVR